MTAKEVLDLAGQYLLEPKVSERMGGDAALLRLVNAVVTEICGEYFPLRTAEEVTSEGEIALSDLGRRLRTVVSVKQDGRKAEFSLLPFSLRVPPGRVRIDYCYLPEPVEDEESALELSPLVDVRTVALGVAGEYALCRNLYEQALAFDNRFRDSLAALAPHRGGRILPRTLS